MARPRNTFKFTPTQLSIVLSAAAGGQLCSRGTAEDTSKRCLIQAALNTTAVKVGLYDRKFGKGTTKLARQFDKAFSAKPASPGRVLDFLKSRNAVA